MNKTIHYKWRIYFLLALFCFAEIIANAQDKKWNFNGSLGFGSSSIINMPSDIYNNGGENIQLGFLSEREISSRFSFVSHVEIDWLVYSFDGYLQSNASNKSLTLIQAPAGTKYTEIHQLMACGSLLCKYTLRGKTFKELDHDNGNSTQKGSLFVQAGLRLASPFLSEYQCRIDNSDKSISLNGYVNHLLFQTELSIGAKGELNGVLSLLDSSTIGIIYQFNPIFNNDGVAKLCPAHFSWRFYF